MMLKQGGLRKPPWTCGLSLWGVHNKKTKTKQNYETPRKCKQKQKQAQGLTTCYYKIWICCNNKTIESLICNCSFFVFMFSLCYSWHLDVKIYLTVRILLELISTVKHNAMKWSELPT